MNYVRVLKALALMTVGGASACGGGGTGTGVPPFVAGQKLYVLDDRGATLGARIVSAVVAKDFSSVIFQTEISGAHTGLIGPRAIERSPSGEVYVVEGDRRSIDVFDANASGDIRPKRSIAGSLTGLLGTSSIAFDAKGDLFVATYTFDPATPATATSSAILEFAPNANGNVAPIHVLRGSAGDLNEPQGVFVDGANNVYVAASGVPDSSGFIAGTVYRFASGQPIGAPPTAVYAGSAPLYLAPIDASTVLAYTPSQFAITLYGQVLDRVHVDPPPVKKTSMSPILLSAYTTPIVTPSSIIVCDPIAHTVDFIDPTTGLVRGQVSGSQLDSFTQPTGVSL